MKESVSRAPRNRTLVLSDRAATGSGRRRTVDSGVRGRLFLGPDYAYISRTAKGQQGRRRAGAGRVLRGQIRPRHAQLCLSLEIGFDTKAEHEYSVTMGRKTTNDGKAHKFGGDWTTTKLEEFVRLGDH